MRLVVLFTAAATIALGLQSGSLHWLPLGALIPDLVLILAVDLGLRHHTARAALMAFMMGLATDAVSGSHVGLNSFMVTLVFLLSYELSRHLWIANNGVAAITVFFAVLIKAFGALGLTGSFGAAHRADSTMIGAAVTQALVTAVLALPVFPLLGGCKRMMRLPQGGERE